MAEHIYFFITGTSPASASTAQVGEEAKGLSRFQHFDFVLKEIGGTGGTVDVYIQRFDTNLNEWVDYAHFPQVAAATTARYVATSQPLTGANPILSVGQGTTPALAANSIIGGHPGDKVRMVVTAGAGTSAGATQMLSIRAWG